MTDRLTTARPYARAAFAEAQQRAELESWSESLRVAAQVVKDPRVAQLLGNPRVTADQLSELVAGIAAGRLGELGRNFVRLLAENGRLAFLPEIAALFDIMKGEAEGVADVTLTSAATVSEAQQQKLAKALTQRLKRQVRLHCEVDPSLIGGAVLHSGDLVIDGSLRTRLERIAYELTV
jgi:F-type H+-transporting ATPase subunit delta